MSATEPAVLFSETSMELERLLIGSILIDAPRCHEVFDIVRGSHFVDRDMGSLYETIAIMYAAGEPINDTAWLASALVTNRAYKSLGGLNWIAEAVGDAIHPGNGVYYAHEVRKYAQRRMLNDIGLKLIQESSDRLMEPEELASEITRELTFVIDNADNDRICMAKGAYDAACQDILSRQRGEQGNGIATGIAALDGLVGTLQPSEMVILAARPSVGKTALALDVMVHAASKQNAKCLFVSGEMNRVQIGQRLISRVTSIATERMMQGMLNADDSQQIVNSEAKIASLPIAIWEASSPTVQQIASQCRAHSAKHGLDLVVVDHIGLLSARAGRKSRYETVTEIATELKALATAINKPVLVLCQLNREGEGEIPQLSMLRDSGAIEECADKVWLLHRDREQEDAMLIVAKYRQGSVGRTKDNSFVFKGDCCSYRDKFAENGWQAG